MREQIDGFLTYLELERGLSPTTRSSYRQDLGLFEAFLKARRIGGLARVRPLHVREFLQSLRASRTPAHVAATYVRGLRLSDKYEVSVTIQASRWTAHLVAGPEGTGPITATSTKGPREAAQNVAKRLREMGYTGAVKVISWPNGEAR